MNIPFLQDATFTGLISTKNDGTSENWKEVYTLVQEESGSWIPNIQSLTYTPSSYNLAISDSNSVNLSSILVSPNTQAVFQSVSAKEPIISPEPYKRNLFSRVLTNDTVVYRGAQVLNSWSRAENGLYYHPLNYYNTETSAITSINANFGLSYNFTGQFTYILSGNNTIKNDNFDFDLISNIQYVDSSNSFLIGQGLGYNSIPSSIINTILSSGDQYYIGGNINYFNDGLTPRSLARINSNGSQDYTFFETATGANKGFITGNFSTPNIYTLKKDNNNKILVGGNFDFYNLLPIAKKIARLNANGSLDATLSAVAYDVGFNNNVLSIEPLFDGKILVGGTFTAYNSQPHRGLIRLNYDGSIDTSLSAVAGSSRFFDPFGNPGEVWQTLIEPDNKMVIGGYFARYNSQTYLSFVRLNYDGSVDTSLSAVAGSNRFSYPSNIWSLIKGLKNSYMLGGSFSLYNNQSHTRFIRLNYDGSVDTSLSAVTGSSRFDSSVFDIVLQPDNKILVGGDFMAYNSQAHGRIIRLNYDGSVDTFFITGTGFNGGVRKILLLNNGKILVGGGFSAYNGEPVKGLALLNSDGTLDTSSQSQFLERIKYKVTSNPGDASIVTSVQNPIYEQFDALFVPTVQDGKICIGSVQPISFGTLDYTLVSNYGSGTVGFGTS